MSNDSDLLEHLDSQLRELREAGTFKIERELEGPQDAGVEVDGRDVIMLT